LPAADDVAIAAAAVQPCLAAGVAVQQVASQLSAVSGVVMLLQPCSLLGCCCCCCCRCAAGCFAALSAAAVIAAAAMLPLYDAAVLAVRQVACTFGLLLMV
jgi:hypothetical protein